MSIGSDFKLKYQIVADAAKAKAEIRDVDDLLRRLGGTAGGAFGAIGAPAAIAGTAVLAIGAAAVSTGVALFNLTKQASDFGSEIFDASKKTGLHAEALSAMKFAAEQSGSSMEQVTNGVAKFAKAVGAAAESTKKGEKFLHDFGFTPQEALKDLDGALDKVFKRIMAAPAGIQRMTLAQKAFGKSGADLLPFLDSFDGDLKGLIKRAKELGVTIDDDAAKAADEFGDQLDTLSAQIAGVGRTIGTAFMPQFMEMAEATSDWAVRNKSEIETWSIAFAAAVEVATSRTQRFLKELFEWKAVMQTMQAFTFVPRLALGLGGLEDEIKRVMERRKTAEAQSPDLFNRLMGVTRPKPGPGPGEADTGGRRLSGSREGKSSEMRRFFEGLGAVVTDDLRPFGSKIAGTKRLSKHGLGEAVDVRTRDKSPAEVFTLIAKAIEHGFRIYDERLAKGQPHLHAEANTTKASTFYGAEMYGGQERLDYLKSLDQQRLGKASGMGGFTDYQAKLAQVSEDEANEAQRVLDEWIAAEETASERRLDIRRAEAEIKISIIEDEIDRGYVSERMGAEAIGQIKFDLLRKEQDELRKMVPTAERLHQIELLDIALTKQAVENEQERNKILRERLALYASLAVEGRSGDEQIADILEAQAEARRKAAEGAMVTAPGSFGGSLADSLGADLVPMWDEVTNAMIGFQERLAMVQSDINDFVGNAIGGMVDGLIQMGIAWVVTGEGSAKAALQMMASVALSIAVQSAIKAIFEAAESVAAYARYDVYAGSMHAAAATLYGTVAMIAGTVGVGLALGARAMGGGSGGGRGSQENADPGFGSRYGGSQNPDPFSRTTGNPFQSGQHSNDARFVQVLERIEQKLDTASPGDVLTRGIGQNRGLVGDTVIKEAKSGKSAAFGKAFGLR